jgi:hypothetical protein
MTLGLTHPLTEMGTRNIPWGEGGLCIWLTTLPLSCADCLKIYEPQPPGTLKACQGLALPFTIETLGMRVYEKESLQFVNSVASLCSHFF